MLHYIMQISTLLHGFQDTIIEANVTIDSLKHDIALSLLKN